MTLNLTVAGLNVLYRALSGTQIVFTRIKLGNGAEQTLDAVADLVNPLLSVNITGIDIDDSHAVISAPFNNSGVDAGFRMTEVGVFCQSPTDEDQEVMFAYGHEPSETADYIAASSSEIRETDIGFDVFFGNSENVSAIINESAVFASKTDFDAHLADDENPHSVTKAQVGLGNVPNVTTNDQTPTYSPAVAPAQLTPGEKLSAAFAKIAAAVTSLISHIGNRENPHGVTASQIGASATGHNHSTADITTGTLSVNRGGTGLNSFTPNGILYASNATSISQLSKPTANSQFLTQSLSGAPEFKYVDAAKVGYYIGDGSDDLAFSDSRPIKIIAIIPATSGEMYILLPSLSFGLCIGGQNAGQVSGLGISAQGASGLKHVLLSLEGTAASRLNAVGATYNYALIF